MDVNQQQFQNILSPLANYTGCKIAQVSEHIYHHKFKEIEI